MRLTVDNILAATTYYNPCYERTIELRGMKVPAIENMGALQDGFDVVDLCDNSIKKLGGFPCLPRLKTLLLSNNRICRIAPNLSEMLPHLESLMLVNNCIEDLGELDGLVGCPIKRLALMENRVTLKQDYRLYCIHLLPSLKLLDFRKVKPQERAAALARFGKLDVKAKREQRTKKNIFVPGEVLPTERGAVPPEAVGATVKRTVDPAKAAAVRAMLAQAQTIEELTRIETALQSDNDAELDALIAKAGLAQPTSSTTEGSRPSESPPEIKPMNKPETESEKMQQ